MLQKLLRTRRRHSCCMLLPVFVLMRIRVIADASNDKTWEVVHQSRSLHFDAENMATKVLVESIPEAGVPDDLVPRCDQAIFHTHFSGFPPHSLRLVAESTTVLFIVSSVGIRRDFVVWSIVTDMAVVSSEQDILQRIGPSGTPAPALAISLSALLDTPVSWIRPTHAPSPISSKL